IKAWVKDRAAVLSASTLRMVYGGVLVPLFQAAVHDRLIGSSPCLGVRLPEIEDADYTIPTPDQVHALHDALPERYRAIVYVVAGCGLRGGEVFGLELDAVNFLRRELAVRQQMKVVIGRRPFLAPPKMKTSRRTVDLPDVVGEALARHLEQFPAGQIELDDDTDERNPRRRQARMVFTNGNGAPINRARWSYVWRPAVQAAGLPAGFGLRDLRHYFATVLIFGGANVKTVQLAMGHTTPTITLNTYVGHWPDALDRTRSLVDSALGCTQSLPTAAAVGVIPGQHAGGGGN
ncbi:MAG TPA: site-specific integrase, partial [Pseudonocardiaceae bacterium]|nr:site-specific integrase [Pseudonocardiaceae bacterium]